ncbi:MAG TPA: FAD-dependent oxidoreductase [Jatrophihabitantaceae bacterium]|nr:FAD-dependent oxidoreductase [Jatrophihabitantaceae bacterium]
MSRCDRRKVAVVGSGVAGLTAAYVLQREADVTLFEAADRLGGHADTHDVVAPDGQLLAVDTGFIVHNRRTYPTLLRLFAELGVQTQESDMSMSISCAGCGLEYAGGRGLSGLLPSARTATSPRYLCMLTEIVRFHRRARALLDTDDDALTLREFLAAGSFTPYFVAHFMTPLIAAVWSTAPTRTGDYPARYLFTFLANHGMLTVTGAPTWYTVVGGSARYVERAAKGLTAVHTATPIRAITRTSAGVEIRDECDVVQGYDSVVIATHPDQALRMITSPTLAQREVLGAIGYTVNPTLLHTDAAVLPRSRRAQASWNYALPACDAAPTSVQLSYNMNRLQRLDVRGETYVVTLNGTERVDPDRVLARMVYEHPVYTSASVAAQDRLPGLNDGVFAFAGAYHGWGFHEDGARSGVAAAESLGVRW